MSVDLEQFASQPPYEEALAAAANQHEVAEEPRTTKTFAQIVAEIRYMEARLDQEGSNCCLNERIEGDKVKQKERKEELIGGESGERKLRVWE